MNSDASAEGSSSFQGNRRGDGGRLRADIVEAATALLDEGGTEHAITLRAVARRVGIAAPSIYPHFADRDALLLAVCQDAFAVLEKALRDVPEHPDPVDHLRAVCGAYLAFAREWPSRYRIMFGAVWDAGQAAERSPGLAADAAALGMTASDVLRGALAACAEAGRSGSVVPASDATALWVGLHGLAQLREAAPLFPWPPRLEAELIERLSLLR
ncbi:hypothetical protein GCM10022254_56160 [Actinomadura meridiana]|uniref:HTH tetR-type domain-containing protein n=1 Tax=Actinomadura meridiana TaxID=559626 RepID=A0ABP8CG68_9ACTN